MLGQIVGQPLIHLGEIIGLIGSHFFLQLAQTCLQRRLTLVDSALRHLPTFDGLVDAATDKNQAVAIDEHDADTRSERQVFMPEELAGAGHGDRLIVSSSSLWPMPAPEQSPGSRDPVPTAPRARRG